MNITLNNGIKIPIIGLGVFRSADGEETTNAVKWALDAGYRHIDTARAYANEKSVGIGIKESAISREDIFITTKIRNEDIRADQVSEAFEQSLSDLDMDYVDMIMIHWPVENYKKAWMDLEKILRDGKTKSIAVSNFHEHHLKALFDISDIKPALNQFECHPKLSQQALIDFCENNGIACEAYSPLGGQGSKILNERPIKELAEKYNKNAAQIVLRWNIQRNVIVIPKSVHKERIASNFDVFDFELSNEDMQRINQMNKNERAGSDPDNFNF